MARGGPGPGLVGGKPPRGERTGIGRYTAALAEELASMSDVDMRAVAFTLRGWRKLRRVLPHGSRARGMPVSARLLRKCWLRAPFPPVELFAGFTDIVHGTNFVLPAAVRARGVLTIHDLAFLDPPQAVPGVTAERISVPVEKIVVTPLGVDLAWFTARPPSEALRRRIGLPKSYLLFVGGAGPRKSLGWLLKAHQATPGPPPLVLAGPGHTTRTETVRSIGYLSDVDLRSVVAGADA